MNVKLLFAVHSESNERLSRKQKSLRVKMQRANTFLMLHNAYVGKKLPSGPLRLRFTRYYGSGERLYDDDNLVRSFKAVRDETMKFLRRNDGNKARDVQYEYTQTNTSANSYCTVQLLPFLPNEASTLRCVRYESIMQDE